MKRLNNEEVKLFAGVLDLTESEARDVADLFYNLKGMNPTNNWRVQLPLNNVDEYILEWENHWHREVNFTACYEYEKDCGIWEYPEDIAARIFASEDAFREYVTGNENSQFVYQLPNNDMVVVVR